MEVILSIKPQYANKIFDGSKVFEFRKAIFKNPNVKKIIVYASSPVKQVIGEFEIEQIISDEPARLWESTKGGSGITEDFFFSYFENKKIAYAIQVRKTVMYEHPLCIKKDFNVLPPQSFSYAK